METKQCSACKQVLALENFSKSGRAATTYRGVPKAQRYSSRCKPCASDYARAWRQANPDYERKRVALSDEEKRARSFFAAKLSDAKGRAGSVGVTIEDIRNMWTGKCAISGLPISMTKGDLDVGSLDQIIPGGGYVPGNVQWLSWRVNRAKGEQSTEQFLDMCRAVVNV